MSVRVKICGITNPADAELAATLGADWIGLNFYAKSPRRIDETTARAIVNSLPAATEPVALFVHEPLGSAQKIAAGLGIRTVQMHTDQREVLPSGVNWIPAFAVADAADLAAIATYLEMLASVGAPPAAILIDARVHGLFGGTGQTAPWHLLADFKPGVPLILAGGLTHENVADAIRIVKPYAVDVASGVESSPGKKDADKLRRFIDAVRAANPSLPAKTDLL
jgi:phosphoribosylanthranilate isomerase